MLFEAALISDNFVLLSLLLMIPAILFYLAEHPITKGFFKVVPLLLFAYFIPTTLSSLGVIPHTAPLYSAIKTYILPACLILLTLSADLRAIIKLGPKALIMFFTGTFGVLIGGVISYLLFHSYLPDDIWKGMGALCGSWIGGGANFLAVGESIGTSDSIMGAMAIVDVVIGSSWMGLLMFFAAESDKIDKALGADNSAIEELKQTVVTFQSKTTRVTTTTDLMLLFTIAFLGTSIAFVLGSLLPPVGDIISHNTWKIMIATAFGIALSFTRARNLEGAGASKLGTVMLYLLIGVIGASAQFGEVMKHPILILMGAVWIVIHLIVMCVMMRILRAPFFLTAVGSQANIGAAASAPIVASAFHPALAPVGVLLGILGYIVGTYAALLFAQGMQLLSRLV
jgi:uncharacterized membrane protein